MGARNTAPTWGTTSIAREVGVIWLVKDETALELRGRYHRQCAGARAVETDPSSTRRPSTSSSPPANPEPRRTFRGARRARLRPPRGVPAPGDVSRALFVPVTDRACMTCRCWDSTGYVGPRHLLIPSTWRRLVNTSVTVAERFRPRHPPRLSDRRFPMAKCIVAALTRPHDGPPLMRVEPRVPVWPGPAGHRVRSREQRSVRHEEIELSDGEPRRRGRRMPATAAHGSRSRAHRGLGDCAAL